MRVFGLLAVAAAALAAVQMVSPSVLAQVNVDVEDAPAEDEGTLIQIGPDGGVNVDVDVDGDRARRLRERMLERRAARQGGVDFAPRAVSRYWIGVGGESVSDAIRAQVDLADNEGLLLGAVDPEGPAGKAGVRRFDILVRANGEPIASIEPLAEIVGQQGEAKAPITLELLRRGKPVVVEVTPEERPAEAAVAVPENFGRRGLFGPGGLFGADGVFANGEGLGEGELGAMLEGMPMAAGVSVSVRREGEGPAQVTVTQGDKTWTFDEGDDEAIAKLPGDVRPMVEQMLNNQGGVFQPGFEGFGLDVPGFQMQLQGDAAMRMRAMEERMRALQSRMGAEPPRSGVPEIAPQENLDEAPAFVPEEPTPPEAEWPTELVVPANPEE
ncbi:PDZ domain-containing protein [Botrimarina mediterranea]|uniref:Putative periplasmic serine endoprotease DegP-like n=1 Tax=Botrimarina mediterranea TaxID=2528022 RepID=A0A518KEI0_9BACT|nr:PDZ domain-containing protein [Botrimarina mediterranea]QDV76194.1 putative periplasmic serine endoprotease DegP-like precursor [Botrimarina mediterranea]